MNKLLQCQLREHFGNTDKVPENISALLNVISGAYDHFEKDKEMTGISMALSLKEMMALKASLKKEKKESEKSFSLLEATLESTADGILVVDINGKVTRVNNKFVEQWRVPPEILNTKDDGKGIAFVSGQLMYPGEFIAKIKELNIRQKEVSFDILHFKDGRIFERYSQPQLIKGKYAGRVWSFRDITERKQAEDKLLVTSKELKHALKAINKIMDSSLDVICAVDAEGYFIQVSAACETVWGYRADELIGKLLIDFVYPEDREKTQTAAINVIAGHNMINFENRYIRKDGSLVPINWSARWDAKDKIRYGVARDATEKRKSEKVFEIERKRFNDLFLEAPSCVGILKGPNHVFEMANPQYLQLIGKKDVIGKSVKEVRPEIAEQGILEILDSVYKTGKSFSANEMLIKIGAEGNGETIYKYANFLYQAYKNNEGSIEGIFFFAVDVTEQVLSRKKIEESEQRFRQIVETAQEGIWMIDENNDTTFINRKMAEILEYPMEEVMGKKNYCFMDEEWKKKSSGHILRRKQGICENHDFKYITKSGRSVWTNLSTNPVFDDAGVYKGALAMVTDITQRKKAEDEIRESEIRYRSLIEQATDAICISDASMKFCDMNPSGCQMLGYSKEEFLLLSVADLFLQEDLKANPFKMDDLHSGKTIRNERRFIRKDGSIIDVELNGKLLQDGRFIMFGRDISERKQTEKLIKESELRYRSLIEQATDAICIADASLKFIDMNPYACQILGYSKEEALQLSVTGIIFLEDLAANPFKFNEAESEQIIRNERRLRKKDGTAVVMEVSTKLMEDGRFIMFGHDITERKKSEEALRESEKRLRQIIDLVPHFIFAKDAEGKFVLANEAVARAYGSTVEDLIGKIDADFNSQKEEVEHFLQEDLKVINSGNVKYNIEETITDAAGNRLILSTTKIPYTSPGLKAPGVLGVSVDITEHKKAEAVLKESEAQLSVATQIAKLGYWEYDVTKNLFKFNDQFYSIFKTTAEDVGGYTMSSEQYAALFVYPDDIPMLTHEAARAIKSHDPHYTCQVEYRIKYPDAGIGYMTFRFFTVKNELGRTIKIFGAIQDITERKKTEETLLRSEADLEIKNKQLEQKNKELEQFAYVASHDLQEPLRTTSSFVELLQKQYKGKLDEKADKYLTFITQSSDRMKVLIKDLLDYSRIGRKKELAVVDCNIMLNEVLADLGQAIHEASAVIIADHLPVISGYPTEIKQLLQNLVMNAIKFRRQHTTPAVNICIQKTGRYWEFVITDNGIGIDEQHRERIFIIFQRLHTRNEYEGSGIGLAHCKKIVELHGGKIWVESIPGEGSSFHFTIPVQNS